MSPYRRLAAAAAALLLAGCGGGGDADEGAAASAPAAEGCPPVSELRVEARVRVGSGAGPLAASAGTLWVARPAAGVLTPVNLAGGTPRAGRALRIGGAPVSLAAGPQGVYVADRDRDRILRVDPARGRVVARSVIQAPIKVELAGEKVASISLDDGELSVHDPRTLFAPLIAVAIPALEPIDMAHLAGDLWVLGGSDHGVAPLDIGRNGFVRAGKRLPTRVVGSMDAGRGAIWVALPTAHAVAGVDGETGALELLRASRDLRPTAVAVDNCAIWAGDGAGRVQRLDPVQGRPLGPSIRTGRSLAALVADRGGVWASDPRGGTVVRVAPGG